MGYRKQLENTANISYNLEQFNKPVYEIPSLKNLLKQRVRDGIYHCAVPERLDLYFENFENKSKNDVQTILVCMNAAVGKRHEKCAPFFSGLGVNRVLKQPLIAISDPTVSSYPLSLAWYAGSEKCLALQKDMASFLDQIASKYKAKLVLFGGSGGGFAALALAAFLKTDTTLLISNPQTSISRYIYGFVKDYIQQAFPSNSAALKALDSKPHSDRVRTLYEALDSFGVLHDVTGLQIPHHIKLIYLQNKSDSHVADHAVPFIKNRKCTLIGQNSLECDNGGIFFGSWGKGHVGPNSNIVAAVLRKIIENQSVKSIIDDLENGLDGLNPNDGRLIFLNRLQYKLFPKTSVADRSINIQCAIKRNGIPFKDDELNYAFYLMDGNKRIASRYYSGLNSYRFDLPKQFQKLSVRCFVRDKFNQIIAADSAQLNIRPEGN